MWEDSERHKCEQYTCVLRCYNEPHYFVCQLRANFRNEREGSSVEGDQG